MSLPYSYKNKIEIPESEEVDITYAINLYENHINSLGFDELEREDSIIQFISDHSLISFKYPVKLQIIKKELISIEYEIHLMQLIKITIALIVFIALFSSFGMTGFLWFSFVFSVIFFLVNLLFVDSYIQKIIKSSQLYLSLNAPEQEGFTDEQKKWLKDKNRCPACGEEITIYDLHCPDCGLKLKQNKHTIPLDVTKYKEKRFKYHYKKRN
ncbi:MAG: zinc ribbon domain-containing protein [Bacteroidota bacterium]